MTIEQDMYDEKEEIWMKVIGSKGMYSVSSLGKIRRDKKGPNTFPGRILKPYATRTGYMLIDFRVNKKRCVKTVHSIVMEAFSGTRPLGLEINHKNGIKDDNRVSNLEYVTRAENVRDTFRRGTGVVPMLKGENSPMAKLKKKDILEIRELYKNGVTQRRIGFIFNVGQSRISSILLKKSWKHI